jgi:hypothetical protein
MISIIQARMALDILLSGTARRFEALKANCVIFYNRRTPAVPMSGFFKSVSIRIKPRGDCTCAKSYEIQA